MSEIKEFAAEIKTRRDERRPSPEKRLNSAVCGVFFVCLFDFYSPWGHFMAILIFISVIENECPLFT